LNLDGVARRGESFGRAGIPRAIRGNFGAGEGDVVCALDGRGGKAVKGALMGGGGKVEGNASGMGKVLIYDSNPNRAVLVTGGGGGKVEVGSGDERGEVVTGLGQSKCQHAVIFGTDGAMAGGVVDDG
jgi:hypothetical protein